MDRTTISCTALTRLARSIRGCSEDSSSISGERCMKAYTIPGARMRTKPDSVPTS